MDGVSLASGIAGLITLALQVSGTIREYVVAAKDKAKNIEELESELILLSENLNNLREILEDEKLKGRSFDADSVLWRAIQDCRKRIERIGDELLPSTGGRVDRALDRIKWPFQQKEVLKMVDNLRRFSSIFQFAVNIENCKILVKTSEDVEKTLSEILTASRKVSELQQQIGMNAEEAISRAAEMESALNFLPLLLEDTLSEVREISHGTRLAELRERERRKTDILDWLSPISSLTKHLHVQAKRTEGTGTWLLEHKEIVRWLSDKSQSPHIICVGGPGTGKTVTSSLVIDHLRNLYSDSDTAVAYYYCSWDEEQVQSSVHFVSTMLRQLCSKLDSIPVCVAEFYQRTKNEVRDQAWFADLQDVLQRVIKTFSRCFLVIDALDELAAQQRIKLLSIVQVTGEAVRDEIAFRLFATSRPHLDVFLVDCKTIEITANEQDLRKLINSKIEEHPHSAHILDSQLKNQIAEKLISNADGMFLLPALQIEDILSNETKSDVRRQLDSLSTNLYDLYTATINRIQTQSEVRRLIARKTLMWLTHVKRQLKVSQLLHALAIRVEDSSSDLDRDNMLLPKTVLDSCCGLVVLEHDSEIIRFHHFSVEEYLRSYETHHLFDAAESELLISRTLLKYMRLEELEQAKAKSRQGFDDLLNALPLFEYAALNWGNHVRNVKVEAIKDLALPFLSSEAQMMAVSRALSSSTPDYRKWHERMASWSQSGGAGVFLAAAFGLDDLIRFLIETCGQNTGARNMYGSSPLHEASLWGFQSTTELLISYGLDVLETNAGNLTPFYLAVSFNHGEVVKSLIKHNQKQLTIPNRQGWSPLHKACDIGLVEMVRTLLQLGANINAADDKGLTPLHLAAQKGHAEVVQILTHASATVHAKDSGRRTPLDLAAIGGHLETARWLLDHGGKVNHRSTDDWTPLHRAARAGHLSVVSLLLNRGAHLFAEDYKGNIPLFCAVRSGSLSVVTTLLGHNPDFKKRQIFHRDKKGEMARIVAFYTTNLHISKYLRGVELEYVPADNAPANRLTRAIEQHDIAAVREIVGHASTAIDEPDSDGQPPLHVAIQEQNFAIASLLIENGASIESVGFHDWRPLQIACSLGNLELVKLCLTHGANVHFKSNTGQTAFHKACSSHSIDVVQLLLQNGAGPHAANPRGMTPLHIAAHHNRLDIARLLISQYDVDVTSVDNVGDTASKWASRSGHFEILEYLRDEEKRVKAERKYRLKKERRLDRQDSAGSIEMTLAMTNAPAKIAEI